MPSPYNTANRNGSLTLAVSATGRTDARSGGNQTPETARQTSASLFAAISIKQLDHDNKRLRKFCWRRDPLAPQHIHLRRPRKKPEKFSDLCD
jgi:hypothetical protein